MSDSDPIAAGWARAGVAFNAAPVAGSVDLEWLLLDTARAMPENARLLPAVGAWLSHYAELVPRHRLAALADEEADADTRAALGLLLDTGDAKRFATLIRG